MKRGAFHAVLLALALFAAFVFGLAPVIGDNTDTLEVALGRHVRVLAGTSANARYFAATASERPRITCAGP